jgi:hypothetical protein
MPMVNKICICIGLAFSDQSWMESPTGPTRKCRESRTKARPERVCCQSALGDASAFLPNRPCSSSTT